MRKKKRAGERKDIKTQFSNLLCDCFKSIFAYTHALITLNGGISRNFRFHSPACLTDDIVELLLVGGRNLVAFELADSRQAEKVVLCAERR